eukprot:COSAG01_NODE_36267_length_520_cov_0.643705_1_plen_57_part_10
MPCIEHVVSLHLVAAHSDSQFPKSMGIAGRRLAHVVSVSHSGYATFQVMDTAKEMTA